MLANANTMPMSPDSICARELRLDDRMTKRRVDLNDGCSAVRHAQRPGELCA